MACLMRLPGRPRTIDNDQVAAEAGFFFGGRPTKQDSRRGLPILRRGSHRFGCPPDRGPTIHLRSGRWLTYCREHRQSHRNGPPGNQLQS
jgi:hypothetical protein